MLTLRPETPILAAVLALVLAGCGASKVEPVVPTDAILALPVPAGLTATATGTSAINLSWNASTDSRVTGYIVRRNGTQVGTPLAASYADTGLAAGTTYTYTVASHDAAGNVSAASASASAKTTSTDTIPPSAPAGLTATPGGASSINLSWSASTDNVGVTGYIVFRNGTQVATPGTTRYSDIGLTASTTYSYAVAARDAAGNVSPNSTSASATTSASNPGGIPPGLGWFSIPNTQFRSICAQENGFPEIAGNTSCSFTVAWSGGAFDTARNRLIIWGGGHSDYGGNEVYALNLDTLTIERLNDPSVPIRNACLTGGIYADGRPASRHTYNHLAYLPVQDAMFAWGGSMYQCGNQGDDAWLFDMSTKTWASKSSTNGPVGGHFGVSIAYDPNNGLVYGQDDVNIFSYNPATDTWTKRSNSPAIGHNKTAAIDPVRKKYFFTSDADSNLYWYDITSPTATLTRQSQATSNCGGFIGNSLAAMEYDPVQNRIIGWSGGDTVYILNPDTLSCTQVTYAGGPADVAAGTYGRFRYSPSLNVFVVCNSVDANCSTLRLTP
jgi:chitodextrinase